MSVRILFLVVFVLISAQALAAPRCPWLTEGSAAKLLEGDVSSTVSAGEGEEGSCDFSRKAGALSYTLEIVVLKQAVAVCPAASVKLSGIGNEALLCGMERSPSEFGQEVSSRVRDLFFTVRLTLRGPRAGAMSVEAQREVVSRAAEQVAGNLY